MPKKKSKKEKSPPKFGGDSDDDGGDVDVVNNHIYFYTDVNNKSALELTKSLEKVKIDICNIKMKYNTEPVIHLHINSYGGCIFSAFCIIDVMRKIQKQGIEIHTYSEGKVASAGTMIAIHGDKRYMGKNAVYLIHELSSMFWGKMSEIEDDWENVNMLMKKIKTMYKENSNLKKKDLDKILKHDIWFEADKCLKLGLIDEII